MADKIISPAMEMKAIEPFEVQHALVGLELNEPDISLLSYFNFFTNLFPLRSSNFLHVLAKIDIVPSLLELEVEELYNSLEVNQQAIKDMEQTILKYYKAPEGMTIQFDVREGNILQELLADVKRFGADLAVIGQKASEGKHAILAKSMARHSEGNVLFIPEKSETKLNNILVPIDFSENSIRALQVALSMNQRLGNKAKVFALHVYDVPDINAYRLSRPRDQFNEMIRTNTLTALENFLDKYSGDQRSEVQSVLIQRDTPRVSRYILDYAQEEEMDFIVMGAKGHSRLHRLFVGSVTERLMSLNKTTPTLIVK